MRTDSAPRNVEIAEMTPDHDLGLTWVRGGPISPGHSRGRGSQILLPVIFLPQKIEFTEPHRRPRAWSPNPRPAALQCGIVPVIPCARVTTHRPTRCRVRRKPRLRAGRARPLAGRVSHPLDDIPNFMSPSHLTPSDQPCLVALHGLLAGLPSYRLTERKQTPKIEESPDTWR